ncbi:hypothetical protein H9P43_007874 [Blastocladiella emersonii ATCC 22665]|nr:hypothetical protein H9P43_007874 [Blastocladiella emersonii ATCC 22665]
MVHLVRGLRLLAISSLGVSLAASAIDVSAVVPDTAKPMVVGTAIDLTAASTAFAHYVLSSYVTRIHLPVAPADPLLPHAVGDEAFEAADYVAACCPPKKAAAYPVIMETVGLWGQRVYTPVRLGDLRSEDQVGRRRDKYLIGEWHANAVLDPETGKVVPGKEETFFVHSKEAELGRLGAAAIPLAHLVNFQLPLDRALMGKKKKMF